MEFQLIRQPGDVLVGISTSGNSKNVLNAIAAAKEKGMKVIGLTGKDGGTMAQLCDVEVRAPESKYADRAQEIHIKVIHSLIDYVETYLLDWKKTISKIKEDDFPLFLCFLFFKSEILLTSVTVENHNDNRKEFCKCGKKMKKFYEELHHHIIKEKVSHHQ